MRRNANGAKARVNYRHAFHAGNHADVLKHAALLACLDYLKKKPAPFAVLDTHAGIGAYDLTSDEARRSPEWKDAASRLFYWPDAPAPFSDLRAALLAENTEGALRFYPGSPALIRSALRPSDRLVACEKHPEDAAALKTRFRGDAQTQIHARDGWEALGALLPFPERRGLVLIDPPYEEERELARAARAIGAALPRFPGGVFIWWRPLKDARELDAADAELRTLAAGVSPRPETLRADLAVAAPMREGKLAASSLMIVNPPFGLADALRAGLPALKTKLVQGDGAFWRVTAS
jgi:23S rRNA (adenine2030-N6)-methyltransferase